MLCRRTAALQRSRPTSEEAFVSRRITCVGLTSQQNGFPWTAAVLVGSTEMEAILRVFMSTAVLKYRTTVLLYYDTTVVQGILLVPVYYILASILQLHLYCSTY